MKDINKIIIKKTASIREGMRMIDEGGLRMALIVDENSCFFGIITDGDIRRGLLAGHGMDAPVSLVANQNPVVASEGESLASIRQKAQAKSVYQVPVLSPQGKIVRLEILSETRAPEKRPNSVVLMAGGLGTRLRPLTESIPKPMLKVGNKPILEHIVENLKRVGLVDLTLCVSYKSHIIQDYFQDGSQFGVSISYVEEEKRMGTAGALQLLPKPPKDPLLVMNGDLLTNMDFSSLLDYHESQGAFGTMGVREFEYQVPYGVVQVNGTQIVSIEEKPVHKFFVSAGIYVLSPEAIQMIPSGQYFDMPDLFKMMIEQKRQASSYLINDYWIDIGRMSDYEKAQMDIDSMSKKD